MSTVTVLPSSPTTLSAWSCGLLATEHDVCARDVEMFATHQVQLHQVLDVLDPDGRVAAPQDRLDHLVRNGRGVVVHGGRGVLALHFDEGLGDRGCDLRRVESDGVAVSFDDGDVENVIFHGNGSFGGMD
jgi:hypothetical protein